MDLTEIKNQIQTTYESLKQMADKNEAEVKKYGEATGETKEAVVKINADLDALKARLDEAETKLNRTGFEGQGQKDETLELRQKAFARYFREGKAGLSAEERKALVEDATGQIIVPEEVDREIFRALPTLTVMRNLCGVRSINSDRIRRTSMNEVTVGWGKLETSATATLADFESTLVPAEAWQYVENIYGLTKVGEDELADTNVNLSEYIASSFAQAFAEAEDTAFIKGTGHANNQPEGILNGTVVTRFETAGAGAVVADDLIKLAYEVPAQYRKNSRYVMNSALELQLRLAKDAQTGQYLWQPSLQAGTPSAFNGYAITIQDDVDGIFTANKEVAIFGDFKAGYRILDRTGSSILRLNEKYIEEDLIGFRFKRRLGGGVIRPTALRILKVKA